jgi:hypothetical protein
MNALIALLFVPWAVANPMSSIIVCTALVYAIMGDKSWLPGARWAVDSFGHIGAGYADFVLDLAEDYP